MSNLSTTFHVAMNIPDLVRLPDDLLLARVKGGSASEMRTALVTMQAKGQIWLPVCECDRRRPDGSCAGHPSTSSEHAE